jgi:aminoglycoside phosphotransferase (APT) family kinase protein
VSTSAELPFVATPPGDIESVTRSASLAAAHWGLPAPTLLRMGMNGIFAAGDDALLRVGRPTAPPKQAIWLAEQLRRRHVRVPTFVRAEPFVTSEHAVFAVAKIDEGGPITWAEVGAMVAQLHSIEVGELAAGYPVPFCGDFPWWDFAALMNDVAADLDGEARAALQRAITGSLPLLVAARRQPPTLCHGDVHPGNVIQSAQGPVLLDWDLLCHGPTAWDHAPLMTWTERWGGEPGIYESFAAGYGRSMRGDDLGEAIAQLRLVAATLMRVRAGRTNAAAAEEAERRLRYWRGEADAPSWRAQ